MSGTPNPPSNQNPAPNSMAAAPNAPQGPTGSAPQAASAPGSPQITSAPAPISYDDFAKVDLRVATILSAEPHPNADKLIVLQLDLGFEKRQIIAGLRGYYEPAALVGKQIIVVANLAPRMMRGLESQGMLLAASTADRSAVIFLTPERAIAPGSKVS